MHGSTILYMYYRVSLRGPSINLAPPRRCCWGAARRTLLMFAQMPRFGEAHTTLEQEFTQIWVCPARTRYRKFCAVSALSLLEVYWAVICVHRNASLAAPRPASRSSRDFDRLHFIFYWCGSRNLSAREKWIKERMQSPEH